MIKFKKLGLSENNLLALDKKGFETPTEIQSLTIPLLLKDEVDIIAQASTGTGKTAAFALPLLEKVDPDNKDIQALILAPTRELVIQVCEEINSLNNNENIKITPIYGGQSIERQIRKLKKGVSIVVGTPGRILDHIRHKRLDLKNIKYFILDEADEMLNMGFIEDVETIIEETPENKRVLLFSATMPERIKKLAEKYMRKYNHIKTNDDIATDLTDQIYFEVKEKDKFEVLCRIIDIENELYSIIFCRTKKDVDELVVKLINRGYSVDGLHGDISQILREKILGKFRKKNISILVATDVAARGIDIINLTHVINYSIPHNPEAYIHRIGRTGRAGNQGTAITFITPSEFRKLHFIKSSTNQKISKKKIPEIDEIINVKKEKYSEEINKLIVEGNFDKYRDWTETLLTENNAEDIITAMLKYTFGNELNKNNYQQIIPPKRKDEDNNLLEEEGRTRLFISKGRKDNITRKKLIKLIQTKAGVDSNKIRNVDIFDNFSFVEVPFNDAEIILDIFKKMKGKDRINIDIAKKKTRGSNRKRRRKTRS
jgi:ATP-dependent RNA helicase DeaD